MSGRHVRLRDLLLGTEGLALLRGLIDGADAEIEARIAEIRDIVAKIDEEPYSLGGDVTELDFRAGYKAWSPVYDTMKNPLLAVEQPVVEAITSAIPAGRALDAACGTGRHARHLARKHSVTGVDGSPHMLEVARKSVPEARFVLGDLEWLPLPDASFDVVVCALALCHFPDLKPSVRDLARVARRGASLVMTDPHPVSVAVLSQAFFRAEDGGMAFVRNYQRKFGDYVDAFKAADLKILSCVEGDFAPEHIGGLAGQFIPDAARQALVGLPFSITFELTKE